MSIYSTRLLIGPHLPDEDEFSPGVVGGYEGSHRPLPGGTGELIMTADVPAWCVPGHENIENFLDEDEPFPVGEWLRLSVSDGDGDMVDVLIDEDAARSLRDDLDAWLGLPKVKAVTG